MSSSRKPFPLSFAQQRLWLLDKLAPGTPFYNIPAALRLRGRPDTRALEAAFAEILRRHEALRTIFGEEDGQPVQYVVPPGPFTIPVVDLGVLDDPAREQALAWLTGDEARRPFDLGHGPLMRLLLLRSGELDHVLMVSMHHIVSDGWSAGILIRELTELYAAFCDGRPSSLPELPIQYIDFAAWQRKRLQGEVLENDLSFWREQLAHLPPVLSLPTDRPRAAVRGFRGETRAFTVPVPVAAKLKALCLKKGTTLFVTLLAAFKVLLYRHSGQTDLPVGFPVANRSRVEIENLIGFFVNTLVLRSDLSGNPTFSALVDQVAQTSIKAYSHQEIPFEKLVEEVHPERTLSHNPLFQVVFSLQNLAIEELRLPGLTIEGIELKSQTAKFDLSLMMANAGDDLQGTFEFNCDLFEATTIERWIGHLQKVLAAAAADPSRPIDLLPLLAAPERHQLLMEWNDTWVAVPQELTLHEQLEAQAERAPEAIAVASREGRWSYGELNRRANQAARHLRSLGVGPDVPVAIYMERGFEMVVALTSILKAGGAYLGLDLSAPMDRLRFILEDSNAAVVLTQERLLPRLPEGGAPRLCLDRGQPLLEGYGGENLDQLTGPENLHSVVYTSGSTGAPKGTLTTISGYLNLCSWYGIFSRHSPQTRSLLATGLNFDASFRSIFSALLYGGRTVLADNGPYDAAALLSTIRDEGVTVITCPPSLMHAVIDLAAGEDFAGLASMRYLHLGGEPVVNAKLRDWVASESCHCTITNVYGLTETSDVSTAEVARREDLERPGTISIGRPQQNHRVYVLNRSGEPQPAGVAGELCIGGAGCSRGFLNRPDLTAQRFAPDPWAPGERMYRTGDLARWLPDGRLEYTGRLDHQVKVRGFRIELGEIEAVLAQAPGVHEAVVLVHETAGDDKRIAAYLRPKSGEELSLQGVRDFLRFRIPEFMVPSGFAIFESLPLNASGKIDRHRLPEPQWGGVESTREYVAPRSREEEELARFWIDLLGVKQVGVDENFFELGGHSLLAMQLIARIRDAFQINLPLRRLFQTPTIAGLAQAIQEISLEGEKSESDVAISTVARGGDLLDSIAVKIQPGGTKPPIFCVHPANGSIHYYFDLAKNLGPDRPVYGLQALDPEGLPAAPVSLEELAALYVRAVRRIQPEGPCLLIGWSLGGVVAFEMARQLHAKGVTCELALLDPSVPELLQEPLDDSLFFLILFARDLGGPGGKMFEVPVEELEALGPEEQLNYVLLKARIHKVLPSGFEAARVEQLFRLFKQNVQALLRYSPQPYEGPVSLFLPEGSPERVQSWRPWLTGRLDVHAIPGTHYSFLQAPNVEILAQAVDKAFTSPIARAPDFEVAAEMGGNP